MSTETERMAEEIFRAVKQYVDTREAQTNRRVDSLDARFGVLERALALVLAGQVKTAPDGFTPELVSRAMRNELHGK